MSLEVDMVKISIDGKYYEVKPEKNLLETCLALGIDIPHFCFHPALGSVGACRLCAVKKFRDKDDTKGRVVMSCMESVTEGLIISVDDADAKAFRAAVIEGLMTNHPHDCPVCDEGGECHLQDMTVMTGHNYRRFDFPKRTYNNQELGPFISHEMNRCIQCYRCVRFYRDYAGGKDLNVFSSRNNVYFGRHEDGVLESEFSGNLVEVCPTGVFTDKTLKQHFTRKWDLSNSPGVCTHCSLGCNTIVSERYGSVRRIMNRYNGAVNGYFLCDRGRFGYEFVNDKTRIKSVQIRSLKDQKIDDVADDYLLSNLAGSFSSDKKIVGIGSPRASLESNFALLSLVGEGNFYHGVSENEYKLSGIISGFLQTNGGYTPSLKQIENADAILVLGEDIVNTAPMMALALRQAVRNVPDREARKKGIPLWNDAPVRELAQDSRSTLFIATSFAGSLDEIAEESLHSTNNDISDLGFLVAKDIDKTAPDAANVNEGLGKLAVKISEALRNAKTPLIITGVSSGDEAIIHAAINIAKALISISADVMISFVLPESNSMGLSLLPGKPFEKALKSDGSNAIDTLVILENDLFRRADEASVLELFRRSSQKIVLDHLPTRTVENGDIIIPAATFAESEGTLINNEGRAQRFYKAVVDKSGIKVSWKWLGELRKISTGADPWKNLDDITESMADHSLFFTSLKHYSPDADFRMMNDKIPRQTIRYSGRTAMNANIAVSEPKPAQDIDSPLAFSMEGQAENPPSSLVPFYWTPGWNSVQALYNYTSEPGSSLKGGDPGIRLFNKKEGTGKGYFAYKDHSDAALNDELNIVPVYQIFGSEELSSKSPAVAQRIKNPYVIISQHDAEVENVKDGEMVKLELNNITLEVMVKIDRGAVAGLAGLSVNLSGLPFVSVPVTGKVHKL
jgi:NADH-quinone oxidoreductase subunit G